MPRSPFQLPPPSDPSPSPAWASNQHPGRGHRLARQHRVGAGDVNSRGGRRAQPGQPWGAQMITVGVPRPPQRCRPGLWVLLEEADMAILPSGPWPGQTAGVHHGVLPPWQGQGESGVGQLAGFPQGQVPRFSEVQGGTRGQGRWGREVICEAGNCQGPGWGQSFTEGTDPQV